MTDQTDNYLFSFTKKKTLLDQSILKTTAFSFEIQDAGTHQCLEFQNRISACTLSAISASVFQSWTEFFFYTLIQ